MQYTPGIKWTTSAPFRTVTVYDAISELPEISNDALDVEDDLSDVENDALDEEEDESNESGASDRENHAFDIKMPHKSEPLTPFQRMVRSMLSNCRRAIDYVFIVLYLVLIVAERSEIKSRR